MTVELSRACKDCGKLFGVGELALADDVANSLSVQERCGDCRAKRSREIHSVGLPYLPIRPMPGFRGRQPRPGTLGMLVRDRAPDVVITRQATFDFSRFGITADDVARFLHTLAERRVVVVEGPTGSGKSTLLPYRLMCPPPPFEPDIHTRFGQILVTQPRQAATRSIPEFVATRLHGSSLGPGFDVGWRHRGAEQRDWRNKLAFVTDGTLVNIITREELDRVSVVFVDEAHERSFNIDLILALLRRALPRFPQLRVVIASATIDTGSFAEFFADESGPAPILTMSGTLHAVECRLSAERQMPLRRLIAGCDQLAANKAVETLAAVGSGDEPAGDVLVFLPTKRKIAQAIRRINRAVERGIEGLERIEVLPLHRELSKAAQDRALAEPVAGVTRVIVATNVAETSLTIEGVVHVVDSGLVLTPFFDAANGATDYEVGWHSQAGVKQRWGRAGRVRDGIAHCLYTQAQYDDEMDDYTEPEIVRAPLEQILLAAKDGGVHDLTSLRWLTEPPSLATERAKRVLAKIGAIDHEGDPTVHGLDLRRFGEDVDTVALLSRADRFGLGTEMAWLLALRDGPRLIERYDGRWESPLRAEVARRQASLRADVDDVDWALRVARGWQTLGMLFATTFALDAPTLRAAEDLAGRWIDALALNKREKGERRTVGLNSGRALRLLVTTALRDFALHRALAQSDQRPALHYIASGDGAAIAALGDERQFSAEAPPQLDLAGEAPLPPVFIALRRTYRNELVDHAGALARTTQLGFLVGVEEEWLALDVDEWALARLIQELQSQQSSAAADLGAPLEVPVGGLHRVVLSADGLVLGQLVSDPWPLDLEVRREVVVVADDFGDVDADAEPSLEDDADEPAGDDEDDEGGGETPTTIAVEDADAPLLARQRAAAAEVDLDGEASPWLADFGDNDDSAYHEPAEDEPVLKPVEQLRRGDAVRVYSAPTGVNSGEVVRVTAVRAAGGTISVAVALPSRDAAAARKRGLRRWHPVEILRGRRDACGVLVVADEGGGEAFLAASDAAADEHAYALPPLVRGELQAAVIAVHEAETDDAETPIKQARLSRLAVIEKGIDALLDGAQHTVRGTVVRIDDHGAVVELGELITSRQVRGDRTEAEHRATVGSTVRIPLVKLPERAEEFALGTEVVIGITRDSREATFELRGVEAPVLRELAGTLAGCGSKLDIPSRRVEIGKPIPFERLAPLWRRGGASLRAATHLWRRSRYTKVSALDIVGLSALPEVGGRAPVTIVDIEPARGLVIVRFADGYTTAVGRGGWARGRGDDLGRFRVGATLEARVIRKNAEVGDAQFTLFDESTDPYATLSVGATVEATVGSSSGPGVSMSVAGGLSGWAHVSELDLSFIEAEQWATEHSGETRRARVLRIDLERPSVYLSLNRVCESSHNIASGLALFLKEEPVRGALRTRGLSAITIEGDPKEVDQVIVRVGTPDAEQMAAVDDYLHRAATGWQTLHLPLRGQQAAMVEDALSSVSGVVTSFRQGMVVHLLCDRGSLDAVWRVIEQRCRVPGVRIGNTGRSRGLLYANEKTGLRELLGDEVARAFTPVDGVQGLSRLRGLSTGRVDQVIAQLRDAGFDAVREDVSDTPPRLTTPRAAETQLANWRAIAQARRPRSTT